MRIRNNSKTKQWLDYNCGGGNIISIKCEETIEVSEDVGKFLLRTLGHENWLVRVDKEPEVVVTETPREEDVKDKVIEDEKDDY